MYVCMYCPTGAFPTRTFPYLSTVSLSYRFMPFPLSSPNGGVIACLFCSAHVLVFGYWSGLFVWVCLGGRVGLGGGMGRDGGGRCLLSRGIGKVVGWLFMGGEWDGGGWRDWGV